MRSNECVICHKDTGRAGMGRSKTKFRGGWVHNTCKQRLDLEKEIIAMKKKQIKGSQNHKNAAAKYWNSRHKEEITKQCH